LRLCPWNDITCLSFWPFWVSDPNACDLMWSAPSACTGNSPESPGRAFPQTIGRLVLNGYGPQRGLLAEPKNMPPLAIIISGNYTQNTIFGTTNQSTIFVHKSQTCRMFVDLRTSLKQSTQNIPTNIHDIVVIMWIVQGQGVYMGIPYRYIPQKCMFNSEHDDTSTVVVQGPWGRGHPQKLPEDIGNVFLDIKVVWPIALPRTLRPQTKLYRTSKAPMTSWRLRNGGGWFMLILQETPPVEHVAVSRNRLHMTLRNGNVRISHEGYTLTEPSGTCLTFQV
jgi:hypothetical protein